MPTLRKIWAFVRRDFLETASYRLNFVFSVAGILFSCLTFFFLSRFLEGLPISTLAPYGGKYFPFALVGIAFYTFLGVGLGSLADNISRAQATGTLEALLVTPTSFTTIVFSSTLFSFLFAALRVVVFFLFGTLFFGVSFARTNVGAALLVFALSTAAFTAMGMLSASWVIIFKKGSGPAGFIFGGVSTLLGGVIFPVQSLYPWLQTFSWLLPITHSLEAMRRSVLMGAGLWELRGEIAALAGFTAILLPAGVFAFGLAVKRAKKTGSLVQY